MSILLPKIPSANPPPLSSSSNTPHLPHPPTQKPTSSRPSPNKFDVTKLKGLASTPVEVIIDVIGPEIVSLNSAFTRCYNSRPPLTTGKRLSYYSHLAETTVLNSNTRPSGLSRSKKNLHGEPKISLQNVSRTFLDLNYPPSLVKLSDVKAAYDLIKSVDGNHELRAEIRVGFSEYLSVYYVLIAGRGFDVSVFEESEKFKINKEVEEEEKENIELDSRSSSQVEKFNEQRKEMIERLQGGMDKRVSINKSINKLKSSSSGVSSGSGNGGERKKYITWEVTISSPQAETQPPQELSSSLPSTPSNSPPHTSENTLYFFVHKISNTPETELQSKAKKTYSQLNLYDNIDMPICYSDVELGLRELGCEAYTDNLDTWVWDWRAREIGDRKILEGGEDSEDEYSDDDDHGVVVVTPNDFTSNVLDFETFWKLLKDFYEEAKETVRLEEVNLVNELCVNVLETAIEKGVVRGGEH